MREVKLPSGFKLHINPAPFAVSNALFKACLAELKGVRLDPNAEADLNFMKDLFCTALSSPNVERCLNDCMKRCTVDGLKIDEQTFEPDARREDYIIACLEVMTENVSPFLRSLFAGLSRAREMLPGSQRP